MGADPNIAGHSLLPKMQPRCLPTLRKMERPCQEKRPGSEHTRSGFWGGPVDLESHNIKTEIKVNWVFKRKKKYQLMWILKGLNPQMAKENGLDCKLRGMKRIQTMVKQDQNLQTQMHKAAGQQAPTTAHPVAGAQPTGLGGRAPLHLGHCPPKLSHNPSLAQVLVLTQSNGIGLHPPGEEEAVKGDKRGRRVEETMQTKEGVGCWGREACFGHHLRRMDFSKRDSASLSPSALSNHGLHCELPKHPSLRWVAPGQGWHKVYGDSRRGRWGDHLWAVCMLEPRA